MPPQEGAGHDQRPLDHDRLPLEEQPKIRRAGRVLVLEERLVPKPIESTVVVIARDRIDRHTELRDDAEGLGHGRLGGRGRVEEVAGHYDKLCLAGANDIPNAAQGVDPLLLDAGPLGGVGDAGKGLAELPVGGVNECDQGVAPCMLNRCSSPLARRIGRLMAALITSREPISVTFFAARVIPV